MSAHFNPAALSTGLSLLLGLLTAGAWAEATCPAGDTPPGAQVQQVAANLVLNGQRSHIVRLTTDRDEATLLAFYRDHLGAHHVETRQQGARLIAAAVGDCFVTVQVTSRADGPAQATVIATRIGAERSHSKVARDTEALLPAGSSVLQTQESDDDGLPYVVLVGSNGHSVQTDRDALVAQFTARGFHMVREDTERQGERAMRLLQLASDTEDATATITDLGNQRALVVQRNRRQR